MLKVDTQELMFLGLRYVDWKQLIISKKLCNAKLYKLLGILCFMHGKIKLAPISFIEMVKWVRLNWIVQDVIKGIINNFFLVLFSCVIHLQSQTDLKWSL